MTQLYEFACLKNGDFSHFERRADRPAHIAHKNIEWYPVIRETGTAFEGVENDAYVIRTPEPVPQTISDRQFFHVLALGGAITQEEALAAVKTGEIPAAIATAVDAIEDETDKFNAKMLLSGAVEFNRNHPLVETFGLALGYTTEQIDDLFRSAEQL